MNQKKYILLFLLSLSISLAAQKGKEAPPLERFADFQIKEVGKNSFQFQSGADQLEVIPVAGANQAPSFGHYWEFGDGHFSFEDNPRHTYTTVPSGDAVLYLTNNYDNGELPKEKPKRPVVILTAVDAVPPASYLPTDTMLLLRNNHDPKPNEKMVGILTYKNPMDVPKNGKLYLFFNESVYKNNHFEMAEARTHFGEIRDDAITIDQLLSERVGDQPLDYWAGIETKAPSSDIEIKTAAYFENVQEALEEGSRTYKEVVAWNTGLIEVGEERNLFVTMRTTASMLKDTTATVTIKSIFVPEGENSYTESTLEMPIVSSHDPNKISVSKTRTSFRKFADKEITYTVHFQNTAEGSADSITIDCTIPAGLDAETVQLKKTHLKKTCLPCEAIKVKGQSCISKEVVNENLVRFTFHHIQLPGKLEAEDRSDTKGYIKYSIKPNKKVKKLNLRSRADIYFDKEESVITNFSTTRFKPGLSVGIKGAYNDFRAETDPDYYALGITLSPFKSYKWYYQAEVTVGRWRTDSQSRNSAILTLEGPGLPVKVVSDTIRNEWSEYYTWDLVPLQLRKNVTSFWSVGAGVELSARVAKITHKTRVEQTDPEGHPFRAPQMLPSVMDNNITWRPSLFVDISLGLVRQGPGLGLRYHVPLGGTLSSHFQFYALCKI